MSSIEVEKLNYLVYCFFKDRELPKTADIFRKECNLPLNKIKRQFKDAVPRLALASIVDNGLKLLEYQCRYEKSEKIQGQNKNVFRPFYKQLQIADTYDKDALLERQEQIRMFCTVFGNPHQRIDALFLAAKTNPLKNLTKLEHHKAAIISCQWDPTSTNRFAVSSVDSNASIWLCTNEVSNFKRTCKVLRHHYFAQDQAYPKGHEIVDLQWSPDGTHILTTSLDTNVRLWSAESSCLTQTLSSKHSGAITAARWSPDGTLIATSSVDGTCIVWAAQTGQILQRNSLHKGSVLSVAWANKTMHASCSSDCKIILWILGIRIPTQTFVGHTSQVTCIDWNCIFEDHSVGWLASGSDDGTVRIWTKHQRLCVHNMCTTANCPIIWLQWSKSFLFNDQVDLLAALNYDNELYVWNGINGDCLQRIVIEGGTCASFSPDGLFILVGTNLGQMLVIESKQSFVPGDNSQQLSSLYTFQLCDQPSSLAEFERITDLAWSSEGNLVIAGSSKGYVYIFEFSEQENKTTTL
ncbi:hypothetical protein GJ496_005081 [Pomphorhynchus laevis]|nr:hypothetical protein GJ496_005081 [Pomphorhynchus laevis]